MSRHNELGKEGEERAANYLIEQGYIILARNYRFGRAEVDIIAQIDQTLAFIEVKTRSNYAFGFPEESVGKTKQKLMARAASEYVYATNLNLAVRFDVIAILKSKNNQWSFKHFEDAFFFYE